jgi:hypothetical protein
MADSQDADHGRRDDVIEVVGKATKNLASNSLPVDDRGSLRVIQQ